MKKIFLALAFLFSITINAQTSVVLTKNQTDAIRYSILPSLSNPFATTSGLQGKQNTFSLTTTGSGAATFTNNILNIPTPSGSGTVTSFSFTNGDIIGNVSNATTTPTLSFTPITTLTNLTSVGTLTTGTIGSTMVIAAPTITQGSDATGDLYYRNSSGKFTRLALGTVGKVLQSNGTLPVYTAYAMPSSVLTTNGILYASTPTTFSLSGNFKYTQATSSLSILNGGNIAIQSPSFSKGLQVLTMICDTSTQTSKITGALKGIRIYGKTNLDLSISDTSVVLGVPLSIPQGVNQRAGKATLSGGTITVANTTITANSIVSPTPIGAGTGYLNYTINPGVGFTIASSLITDTRVVSYIIVENP